MLRIASTFAAPGLQAAPVEQVEQVDQVERVEQIEQVERVERIGQTWKEVGESVWEKNDGGYSFKKAHAIAYAQLVVVNLNLLCEPA